jgi:membrane-bound lytic murein transglycosylase MltF
MLHIDCLRTRWLLVLLTACCAGTEAIAATKLPESGQDSKLLGESPAFNQPWTGDLDGMRNRGYIRVLVPYNQSFFFFDGLQPRGMAYEFMTEFGNEIARADKGAIKTRIEFIPVSREHFVSDVVAGRGDVAMAGLTITPERERQVDFVPYEKTIQEVVVLGAGAPALHSLDELSGQRVYVRKSSSYYESLLQLNARLKTAGHRPVRIVLADENLEDEDILDLVNAGVVQITLCDRYIASTWAPVLTNLRVRTDLVARADAHLGPVVRKTSPQLKAALEAFVKTHGPGSTFGNVLIKRYTSANAWIRNPNATEERQRFDEALPFFEKYADQYGFDHLLIAAQAYQESRIDQKLESPAGAVGVMQIKPATAADANVGVPDIQRLEDNIHAGVKYLRFVADRYFSDAHFDELNRHVFAFAAYNAGPARIQKLRQQAIKEGFDGDRWFNNVEIIAARDVGREPVDYVRNILKYWVAYRLAHEQQEEDSPPPKEPGRSAVAR